MSDQLVTVYNAPSYSEAEMVHQKLGDAGIKSFVEPTPSPFDGLTAAGQGTPIMVGEDDYAEAERIVKAFLAEHAPDDASDDSTET